MCENDVLEILARRTGLARAAIRPDARILQDLKLDGDDAIDAILEVAKRCHMDLSKFRAELYFRSEPSLMSLFKQTQQPEQVLTVEQLIEAANQGVLR
jgi:hypothetical protein